MTQTVEQGHLYRVEGFVNGEWHPAGIANAAGAQHMIDTFTIPVRVTLAEVQR